MKTQLPTALIEAIAAAITQARKDPELWAKVQARAEQIKEGNKNG